MNYFGTFRACCEHCGFDYGNVVHPALLDCGVCRCPHCGQTSYNITEVPAPYVPLTREELSRFLIEALGEESVQEDLDWAWQMHTEQRWSAQAIRKDLARVLLG